MRQFDNSVLRLLKRLWRARFAKRHSDRHRRHGERETAVDQTMADLQAEHGEVLASIARLRADEQVALRPFLESIHLHTNGLEAAVYRANAILEKEAKLWEREGATEQQRADEMIALVRERLGEAGAPHLAASSAHGPGPPLPTVRE